MFDWLDQVGSIVAASWRSRLRELTIYQLHGERLHSLHSLGICAYGNETFHRRDADLVAKMIYVHRFSLPFCDSNTYYDSNGSIEYPVNCQCVATIAGDPDIAGPGVHSFF